MTISNEQLQQLRVAFEVWRSQEEIAGRPFPEASAFDAISADAVRYGALEGTRSAFARAVFEAAKAGKIRVHQPAPPPPPIPQDFEEQLRAMTPTELRKKLNTDPAFADLFGRVASGEKPEGHVASDEYELTAQQWRSLPPDVAARKMQNPHFRAAVDKLIAQGVI